MVEKLPPANVATALDKNSKLENRIVINPTAVLGALQNTHFEAANHDAYIESREERKGARAITDPNAQQWLEDIHLNRDYKFMLPTYKAGIITFKEGKPTFDINAIKGKTWKDILPTAPDARANIATFYECLERTGVQNLPEKELFASLNERQLAGLPKNFLKETVLLPESLESLLTGKKGERVYGNFKRGEGWFDPITLPDGSTTTAMEIKIAQAMQEFGVKRTSTGLVFTHGELTGQRATLSKILSPKENKGGLPPKSNSAEIFARYIPNLRKAGLIQEGDFTINEQGSESPQIILRKKVGADANLRSSRGGAKYYFGRNKYIHNNQTLAQNTFTASLDDTTAGIFEERGGTRKLLYIFPLMTVEELEEEKSRLASKFNKKVDDLTAAEIIQGSRKKLRPEEIKEYSVTDYLSEYSGESTKEYGKRLERFSNTESVINIVNDICISANLNHFALSWGKKIRLAEATERIEKEKVISFAKQFGIEGLQVMLASEVDKTWPEEVLSYAKKPGMKELFTAFAPLLTDEDEFKNTIDVSVVDNEGARNYLADLRRSSLQDVIVGIRKTINGEVPFEEVVAKSRDGVLAKFTLVKALKKEGLLNSIEDIRGVRFEVLEPQHLSDADKQSMRTMYAQNYTSTPNLQQRLLSTFDTHTATKSGQERFFIFRDQDQIKGYYRLEDQGSGHLYFGAFNVDPVYAGYKLGETMLAESLDIEAKNSIINADCDSKSPVCSFYMENGFVATNAYALDEIEALTIVRNDAESNSIFKSKELSREEIIKRASLGEKSSTLVFASASIKKMKELPLSLLKQENTNQHWVLTRHFRTKDEKGDERVYTVFEAITDAEYEQLTSASTRTE